jgi:hypothetical protein
MWFGDGVIAPRMKMKNIEKWKLWVINRFLYERLGYFGEIVKEGYTRECAVQE